MCRTYFSSIYIQRENTYILLHSHVPISLQEVDRFDDLDRLLKNRGFQGVHKVYTSQKFSYLICIAGAFFIYLVFF